VVTEPVQQTPGYVRLDFPRTHFGAQRRAELDLRQSAAGRA
jgi:hypothetical protein